MWAAKLVLESQPKWLRHFYLFDKRKRQVERLEALKAEQPNVKGRTIHVFEGDFNSEIVKLLNDKQISQKEATLCLLDQRTFQCHWETLVRLANYKEKGTHKVELFYFLGFAWLARALSGVRNNRLLQEWWGRDDWPEVKNMPPEQIKREIVSRFKSEMGYQSAMPFPIFDHKGGGRIMSYMIHATDHPVAPHLMPRAYNRAIQPRETPEQFSLAFEEESRAFGAEWQKPD
jgi:three-Cys-motif partner protein